MSPTITHASRRAAARMLTVAQRLGESRMLADSLYLRSAAEELLRAVRDAEASERMPLDCDADLSDPAQLDLASRPMGI